jgi:hypothetical protein
MLYARVDRRKTLHARGTDTLPCGECVQAARNLDLSSCTGVAFPSVQPAMRWG